MRNPSSPRSVHGLSLIELMIAMVLGLLVVGAAIGIFASNRQAYRATEGVGRVQEAARVAFELMARDIREAGGNPCDKGLPVANVLSNAGAVWWSDWNQGVRGYDNAQAAPAVAFGTNPGERVQGTDAIELKSGATTGATVASHQPESAMFHVNTVNHGLDDGDIAIACDNRQAAIFVITNAQPGTNETIVHNSGTGTPNNCTTGLGVPVPAPCTQPAGVRYTYGPNSTLVKLRAVFWYVGNNPNGRSLYQVRLLTSGGSAGTQREEITDGVVDMQITYLVNGGYVAAGAVADWSAVSAVRLTVTLETLEALSTDGTPIQRQLIHTVAIRNRNA